MANLHETADILARWRDAERRLDETQPGTPEAESLQAEVSALRDAYQQLMEQPGAEPSGRSDPSNAGAIA